MANGTFPALCPLMSAALTTPVTADYLVTMEDE